MRHINSIEDKLFNGGFLSVLILSAVSLACIFAGGNTVVGTVVLTIGTLCFMVALMLLIALLIGYSISYHYYKGIQYGNSYYDIKHGVQSALVEARKYDKDSINHIHLPKIKIELNDDLKKGKIYVQNTPNLNRELSGFDMSSAIGKYIVDTWYLTDDRNYYVYEIYNSHCLEAIEINSLKDFITLAKEFDKYTLFLDANTSMKIQHMLICGATRSGKTYLLYLLVLQMILKLPLNGIKYHLSFADPKHSSLWVLGKMINLKHDCYNVDDIIDELDEFHSSMLKRQETLSKLQIGKLDSDYKDFNLEPYILLFDEFAAFMGALQTYPKQTRDKVMSCLRDIVLMGAGSGYFLWIVMQKSDATTIPTMIRDSLTFKVVLGDAEQTTYTTTFGTGYEIPNRLFSTGEGLYTNAGYTNMPQLLFVPHMNFDIGKAIVKANELG